MNVEIWSDVACPFCYVGKRHFEQALERFDGEVTVTWRAFQLDPSRPRDPEGDVHDLLARKVGGRERAIELNRQMTAMAAAAGLDFHLDQTIPANTFDAHRLSHLALREGVQDAVVERLFQAYFVNGEHIGDTETLVRIGTESGMDGDAVRAVLAGDAEGDAVRDDIQTAAGFGLRGVPTFVIGRRYGLTGAQPVEQILEGLERIAGDLAAAE
jgi:predicted DsbA family dithiol-disulfide isomerase